MRGGALATAIATEIERHERELKALREMQAATIEIFPFADALDLEEQPAELPAAAEERPNIPADMPAEDPVEPEADEDEPQQPRMREGFYETRPQERRAREHADELEALLQSQGPMVKAALCASTGWTSSVVDTALRRLTTAEPPRAHRTGEERPGPNGGRSSPEFAAGPLPDDPESTRGQPAGHDQPEDQAQREAPADIRPVDPPADAGPDDERTPRVLSCLAEGSVLTQTLCQRADVDQTFLRDLAREGLIQRQGGRYGMTIKGLALHEGVAA